MVPKSGPGKTVRIIRGDELTGDELTRGYCIFFNCVKFQNPRTEASYQSVADKVLYKHKFLQNVIIITLKHRHQRCKAPSLCKTFFITSNCRLNEAGQNNYLSHNVFLNAFLTPFFSQRLSHNVFLTTSFSQRLIQNVFLTLLPLHIRPHNVTGFIQIFQNKIP